MAAQTMHPRLFLTILGLLWMVHAPAQRSSIDSLVLLFSKTDNDTLRYLSADRLSLSYAENNPDSSYYFGSASLNISRKMELPLHEAISLAKMGYAEINRGNYPKALRHLLEGLSIAEEQKNRGGLLPARYRDRMLLFFPAPDSSFYKNVVGLLHVFLGVLYENMNEYEKELPHIRLAESYAAALGDSLQVATSFYILGRIYLMLNKPDSGLFYEQKAYEIVKADSSYDPSGIFLNTGKCYMALGLPSLASDYLRMAQAGSITARYHRGQIAAELALSDICRQEGRTDSALYFSNHALELSKQIKFPDLLLRSYTSLAGLYSRSGRFDSASRYQGLIIQLKDSIFTAKQIQQFQNIEFDEQQRLQELAAAQKAYAERTRTYGLLAGLAVFILAAILLWRNNRYRARAYALLQKQKAETDRQKTKLETTLKELESTQAQLVQREKMASLGELTAGIAHEIQNPLNFVNNFSEVNSELLQELSSGPLQKLEGQEKEAALGIIRDLSGNMEKINHHGKRADSIVKGMLQHSRAGTSQKEPTNINAMADEYLKLSYHGFRTRDKSFNVSLETDFDDRIGHIRVVPQDMGRVLLNLYNNAFYSVSEKNKNSGAGRLKESSPAVENGYQASVQVSTKKIEIVPGSGDGEAGVEIRVRDNGMGIPADRIHKIFQPFYTSKPAGEGTGLGLSISYDIITKEHGGSISVDTREGEFAEFTIRIPG